MTATLRVSPVPSNLYVVGERVVAGSGDDLDVGEVVAAYPDGYVVAWSGGTRTVDPLTDAVRVSTLAPLVDVVQAASERPTLPCEAEAAAGRWWRCGFSATEASEWLAVGCFDAGVARRLADLAIDPSEVAVPVAETPDSETVGRAVARGDMTVKGVVKMLSRAMS